MNVSVVAISTGKDAADLAVSDVDALREAIGSAVTAPKYFLDRFLEHHDIARPEGKKAVAAAYAPLLLSMESDIDRDFWRKELTAHIGADDRAVLSVLRKQQAEQEREAGYRKDAADEGEATEANSGFSSRSETVRNHIIGILLLDPARVADLPSEGPVREMIAGDTLFAAIDADGDGGVTDRMTDEAEKPRAATLLFEAERATETEDMSDFERDEARKAALDDLLGQLKKELDREEKARLASEIEAAREAGDKEREKELLSRLSGRKDD